jgi:hypothetical protein
MLREVSKALSGALGSPNEPTPPPATQPPPAPPAPPAAPSGGARDTAIFLLLVGLGLAYFIEGESSAFKPEEGFVLFAGFYVAAQTVERLFEFVFPPGTGDPQAKADRAAILGGLATVAGVGLSLALGLRFLEAVAVDAPPRWLDVFVTGLIIGAGTKPLHDLISRLEKKKEQAAT